MINPAGAILDGLSAATANWHLAGYILMILVISQVFLISVLRRIFEDRFSAEEYLSLGLAGWLLPVSLLSLLWYADERILSGSLLSGIVLVIGLALAVRNLKPMAASPKTTSVLLVLLAVFFIVLRLAYVSKAIFPLYFDSAQHYLYIRQILAGLGSSGTAAETLPGYYHLGFHFLSAFFVGLTGAEISETMLVLGQAILALTPFSAFFIVKHWTRSTLAGFFALALATFGWYMPAHAVDWGKYPALASLASLPFVTCLAYLSIENRTLLSNGRRIGLTFLLLAGGLVSVMLHSRSLVVYALLAVTWLVTSGWKRTTKRLQLLLMGLFLLVLTGEIIFIRSQGILGPLLDAYGRQAVVIAIAALVLSFFAWRSYPALVFFCVVSAALLFASLFVPVVNLIPGYANTTLLDRPYVQMIFYLPLTLLAGFGLAGLERQLQDITIVWGKKQFAWGRVIGVCLILLVAANAFFRYDLYPSDCCVIVSRDDLAAIDWMDRNLPAGPLILVSSTDLNVLPTDRYQGIAGGDAGTWITPLTGRPVVYLPYNTDFSQRQTLDLICQQHVSYVYVGKTGWSFDDSRMVVISDGYRPLLSLPEARVYEVTGCG